MRIDLINGAYLQIGGELGRYHSLPIDVLIRISQHLQELITTIAQYDLPADDLLNLDNFKMEIVDFKKGSAVPAFAFSQRSENMIGPDCANHRVIVNERFEKITEIANSGDYKKLKELYPEPYRRNSIVENYYLIQCELLDLIGTGDTKDEAESAFNEEFDYLYKKLNSLDDQQLTKHNQIVKTIINYLVEKIES